MRLPWRCRAALALWALLPLGCTAPPPPDLFVVVIDTLRADRLGAYGSQGGATPFLDEWAGRSTVFLRAYAQGAWTKPSVAALLTSRYPSQTGVVDLESALPDSELTLPEILSEHGYVTAGFSANTLVTRGFGFAQGYDHYRALRPRGGTPMLRPSVDAGRLNRHVLEWLDGMPDPGTPRAPFFLYAHYMEPHTPYDPPPQMAHHVFEGEPLPDATAVSRAALESFAKGTSPELIEDVRRYYDAELIALDRALRRLFEELEARGLLDDAVVLVTSDHGEELGERGSLGHGHSLYEELVRIPLLLRLPGQTRRADVSAVVSHVDLAPTLLDLAGIEPPPGFEGGSLRPLVERARAGDGAPPDVPRVALSEQLGRRRPHHLHRRALVVGGHKLVETVEGEREFYALAGDPGERDPEALPEARRRELERRLERLAGDAARSAASPRVAPIDADTAERLRALGYAP